MTPRVASTSNAFSSAALHQAELNQRVLEGIQIGHRAGDVAARRSPFRGRDATGPASVASPRLRAPGPRAPKSCSKGEPSFPRAFIGPLSARSPLGMPALSPVRPL